ncbi:hypothetical protein ACIQW5_29615, partial [Methylorubrum thiocyanatum]
RVEDAAIRPHRAPLGSCPIQSQSGSRSAHVERTHAWFNSFRRLSIRYERRSDIYEAFTTLAASLITLNQIKRFC